jgi:hypothetical protein
MEAEKAYIQRQIKRLQIARYRAEQKPNVPQEELANIERDLQILTNILCVLIQAEGKNET